MSSAATPAAPKAMPEAALQSHVLAFTMEDIIHSSQSIQESRVKREKKGYLPFGHLSLSLLAVCPSCGLPALLPVFSSLSLGIYIRLVTSQKLEGRRGHLFTKLTIFTFYLFYYHFSIKKISITSSHIIFFWRKKLHSPSTLALIKKKVHPHSVGAEEDATVNHVRCIKKIRVQIYKI